MAAISAFAQSFRRGREEAGDDEPVEGAGARLDAAVVRLERRPQIGQARLDIGRRGDDRRDRAGAGADRQAVERRGCDLDLRLVGEDEAILAPDAP